MRESAMALCAVGKGEITIQTNVIKLCVFNGAVDPDDKISDLYRERVHCSLRHELRYVVRQALHEVPRLGFTRDLALERHAVKSVSSMESLTSLISGF